MKKKLIIINGTMGVGKTTTCELLNKRLEHSIWLDGDWCWKMNPFIVNEENKRMVENNIRYLLRNYCRNSNFHYIIFNWLIHTEDIMNSIMEWLDDFDLDVYKITLICDQETLKNRLLKDIENKLRNDQSIIERSINRLPLFEQLNTIKIDTSHLQVNDTVAKIIDIIHERE